MALQGAELSVRVKKSTEKISENVHIFANDPSLAFYRIQEHVRKVLPPILEKRAEVLLLQGNLKGHCYDLEYSAQALKSIGDSDNLFRNIQEMIKKSIFLKQQLKNGKNKNSVKKDNTKYSVYKRFSAHLTIDLPELPDFSSHFIRDSNHCIEELISNPVETPPTQASSVELQRSHTTLH